MVAILWAWVVKPRRTQRWAAGGRGAAGDIAVKEDKRPRIDVSNTATRRKDNLFPVLARQLLLIAASPPGIQPLGETGMRTTGPRAATSTRSHHRSTRRRHLTGLRNTLGNICMSRSESILTAV